MSYGINVSVFTDGRPDCIRAAIASFEANVTLPAPARHWFVIVDDSDSVEYREFLRTEFGDRRADGRQWNVLSNARRLGFGGTIRREWERLAMRPAGANRVEFPRFVFHLEDDFTFNRPIDLTPLAALLDLRPYLAQVALRRQPWNDAEAEAGGIVELHPEAYIEGDIDTWTDPAWPSGVAVPERAVRWLEHRLFFTTNPSLYRRSLCERGWPDGARSEGRFAADLFDSDPDARSAYWGGRDSGEAVQHVGRFRVGTGY